MVGDRFDENGIAQAASFKNGNKQNTPHILLVCVLKKPIASQSERRQLCELMLNGASLCGDYYDGEPVTSVTKCLASLRATRWSLRIKVSALG